MSEKNEKLSLVEIWNTLSENAQLMVISFAPAGGLSQSSEIVDMMAKPNPKFNWDGFDAVSAIEELENFGVLEEINGL